MQGHWADCAIYNEPAVEAGPCNCGGLDLPVNPRKRRVTPAITISRSLTALLGKVHGESLIDVHQFPTGGLPADAAAAHLPDPHSTVSGREFANRMDFDNPGKPAVTKFKAHPAKPSGLG